MSVQLGGEESATWRRTWTVRLDEDDPGPQCVPICRKGRVVIVMRSCTLNVCRWEVLQGERGGAKGVRRTSSVSDE